jgi:hypothetical protein
VICLLYLINRGLGAGVWQRLYWLANMSIDCLWSIIVTVHSFDCLIHWSRWPLHSLILLISFLRARRAQPFASSSHLEPSFPLMHATCLLVFLVLHRLDQLIACLIACRYAIDALFTFRELRVLRDCNNVLEGVISHVTYLPTTFSDTTHQRINQSRKNLIFRIFYWLSNLF